VRVELTRPALKGKKEAGVRDSQAREYGSDSSVRTRSSEIEVISWFDWIPVTLAAKPCIAFRKFLLQVIGWLLQN